MPQPRYWIGVADKAHVIKGVEGGFCQLCHGKKSAILRLKPGDWIVYYSPRQAMKNGDVIQAFTALGQVLSGDPYPVKMSDDFVPYRRNVEFKFVQEAAIRPLLPQLSFIKHKTSWGIVFRAGLIEISAADFQHIAKAMDVAAIIPA